MTEIPTKFSLKNALIVIAKDIIEVASSSHTLSDDLYGVAAIYDQP
jgi:hypothetical protein